METGTGGQAHYNYQYSEALSVNSIFNFYRFYYIENN